MIARDRYEAYDLLESVEVEYEQLPYETDPFRAMEDKVKVYSKAESNIYAKRSSLEEKRRKSWNNLQSCYPENSITKGL